MSEQLGKIDHDTFTKMIHDYCGAKRPEVRIGPGFGVDVSVVDLPGALAMVQTSDPLSLVPSLGLEESAWLSVHLMVNDMATTGFAPQYGQFVLNLPATFSKDDFATYWQYISKFCKTVGTQITGGHTGFIQGQNSTIAGGGTLTTLAPKDEILVSKKAQPGDIILMTKSAGLSASAILALSFPATVRDKCGREVQQKVASFFYDTSSLPEALTAKDIASDGITAMHDVTEGGVLGAVYEMMTASQCGAVIEGDAIYVRKEVAALCEVFDLDPRYIIGAGTMIMTCKADHVELVRKALGDQDIDCTAIGKVIAKEKGISIQENGRSNPLRYLEKDPYWSAFFNAIQKGWK